LITWSSET